MQLPYSMIQWLFFFYMYCFLGWCFESVYVSLKSRKWVNRGFVRGPFLPLYGTGAIMMLVVSLPFQEHMVLVYLSGCVGATILEYVTGVVMEALFKVRYWDYSNQPFNFQGHICLGSSLAWGFLTILMTEVLHKPVEYLVLEIPQVVLTPLTLALTAILGADFALSFKAALDLRNVLVKMEKAKEELLHIQKRLDVIIAVANEELENRKDNVVENIAQHRLNLSEIKDAKAELLKENIEERLENLKKQVQTRHSDYLESVREEVLELKIKYTRNIEDRERLSGLKDVFQRSLLRSHPTMSSGRFKEALEELKKRVEEDKRDTEK